MTIKRNYLLAKSVIVCLAFTLVFSSCNNNDEEVTVMNTSKEYLNILGTKVELKDNALSFKNEAELQELIDLSKKQIIKTRLVGDGTFHEKNDKSWKVDGFKSLYDIFVEAMNNAESYYDREGGYEDFKEKYSILYFPEVKNDYSAFLPVDDVNLAKFLNKDGEILINGKIVNMKNVNSYEQLEKLGWTYSDTFTELDTELRTRATDLNGYYYISINETIYREDGERKNKITRESISYESIPGDNLNIRKHVYGQHIFRKKGFLGIWYNYSSKACIAIGLRLKNAPDPVEGAPNQSFDSGFSPLDYHISYVVPQNNTSATHSFSAWHKGVGFWSIINI